MSCTEVILVNTPPEYGDDYWTSRICEMLNGNLSFDSIQVITDIVYGGVYDKLRIFEKCCQPDCQYIYFDLDIEIKGNVNHLFRDDFTVLNAWWRQKHHTPLNSSIMSWKGDYSHIHKKFNSDPDYYMVKYNKGIDEFLYHEIQYSTYEKVCDCYSWPTDGEYPITLYSQNKNLLI